jgi:regulator of replication initiation timing
MSDTSLIEGVEFEVVTDTAPHFDISVEIHRIRQRIGYLERLRSNDQRKFDEVSAWQDKYARSHRDMVATLEQLIDQSLNFPKAISTLKNAITALTKTVESQVEESAKWHVELSRLYVEMVSAISNTKDDVSETTKIVKEHEKRESVITKTVVVLYSLLSGAVTLALIGLWDATLWPRVKGAAIVLLTGV